MRLILTISTLLHCLAINAGDVRLPMQQASQIAYGVVSTVGPDELYIVDSDEPLLCVTSPAGVLNVKQMTGPIVFPGRFAGGTKIEFREFKGPFLYAITAETGGTAELICVSVADGVPVEKTRVRLTITGPRPPPQPVPPGPTPQPVPPKPDPVDPIQPQKLQVVIIHDTLAHAKYPAEQIGIMYGDEVREYCKSHCSVSDGTQDFRVLSHRQDVSKSAKWIQEAFSEPRSTLPWIVIVTPTKRISGPLPKTIPETMDLLKKYGG